ncbi:Pyridoxal kinase [Streptococcus sp. DD10]|nr:Pyridoxal kinase [Streptococcus sp. DD10]
MKHPRIIFANSMTGLGRVSTTTALPLFAACQVEVAVLPTVLLSSHTGGFPGTYVQSYTQGMQAFLRQWQSLQLDFSAMVTGYLRESAQVDLIFDFANQEKIPLLVDPIMGDRGRLYAGFTKSFVQSMQKLASRAKLILPNLTEACLLLNRPYPESPLTESDYQEICLGLHNLGAETIVLTGLELSDEQIGVALYEGEKQYFQLYTTRKFSQHFFGTGDMVTALLASAWVQGLSLEIILLAVLDFMDASLERTLEEQVDLRMGVYYQPFLGEWVQKFQRIMEEYHEKDKSYLA